MYLDESEMAVLMTRVADAHSRQRPGKSTQDLLGELYGMYVPDTNSFQQALAAQEVVDTICTFRKTCDGVKVYGDLYIETQLMELLRPLTLAEQCRKLHAICQSLTALDTWIRREALVNPEFDRELRKKLAGDRKTAAKLFGTMEEYFGGFSTEARDSLLKKAVAAIAGKGLKWSEAGPLVDDPAAENQLVEDAETGILSVILYGMAVSGEIWNAPDDVTLEQMVVGVASGRLVAQVREEMERNGIHYTVSAQKMEVISTAVSLLLACGILGAGCVLLVTAEIPYTLLTGLIYSCACTLAVAAYLGSQSFLHGVYEKNHVVADGRMVDPNNTLSVADADIITQPGKVSLPNEDQPPVNPADEDAEIIF